MSLRSEIKSLLQSLYSPAINVIYAGNAEANIVLDGEAMPCCVLHEFGTFNSEEVGNAELEPTVITVEFLDVPAVMVDYADTNDVIIETMKNSYGRPFIKALRSNNTNFLRFNDRAQGEKISEGKYDVGAIGVVYTLELTLKAGYLGTC